MRHQNGYRVIPAACVAALALGSTLLSRSSADEVRGSMQVRAAVVARTRVTVLSPETFVITPADLARGFVRIDEPVQIAVLSNTRRGLALDIQAAEGLFKAVRVQGSGIDATLPGEGGTVAWYWEQRPTVRDAVSLDLSFTFTLDSDAAAGTHAWPLLVNGRALDQ